MFNNPRLAAQSVRTILLLLIALPILVAAQSESSEAAVYRHIKSFQLSGGKAEVSNLTLKRDRVVMTFTGTFYFTKPVSGKVTGAVFVGRGTFNAPAPPSDFERTNLKRLLKVDAINSDFSVSGFTTSRSLRTSSSTRYKISRMVR